MSDGDEAVGGPMINGVPLPDLTGRDLVPLFVGAYVAHMSTTLEEPSVEASALRQLSMIVDGGSIDVDAFTAEELLTTAEVLADPTDVMADAIAERFCCPRVSLSAFTAGVRDIRSRLNAAARRLPSRAGGSGDWDVT